MSVHWFWIVGWFVTLFGLVGNSWVIFIIAKRRRLHTTANWFILSLAIADLSVTCGYFPASMVCNVLVQSCNNFIRQYFVNFFMEASMFALITMVAERYLAIVYPLKYVRVMTTKRIVVIIVMSWVTPAILSVFRWIYDLYYNRLSIAEENTIITLYTLLTEIAPMIILIAFTLHILCIARKLSIQMSTLLAQVRFNQAANSATITVNAPRIGLKAATVRLVIALVVIYVACYGTEIYITICQTFEICYASVAELTAFSLLLMANSVLNPLVYAFLKEDIKKETKSLFCRRKGSRIKPRFLFRARQEWWVETIFPQGTLELFVQENSWFDTIDHSDENATSAKRCTRLVQKG